MRPRVTEREAVVAAAREAIAQHGFLHVDMDGIARATGVSRATLYRYAGSRRALVREVLIVECADLVERIGAAVDAAADGESAVRAVVRAGLEAVASQPVLARAAGPDLRAVLTELTVDGGRLLGHLANLLAPVLERARSRGLLRADADTRFAAEEIVRFVVGRVTTPSADGVAPDPVAVGERALRLFGPLLLP